MSSMLVPPESSSAVLVMMCSKSVSICNRSLARLGDSNRNRTFSRGYPNLMHSYGGLLEPRGPNFAPLKSMFNAEHFICRLSWSILNGFGAILNCVLQPKIAENLTKTPIFWVQGRSRSSMLVPLESLSAVLVMISS